MAGFSNARVSAQCDLYGSRFFAIAIIFTSRLASSVLAAQVQAVPSQLCADGRETHPLPNAYPETKLPPQEALGKNA